MSRETTTEPGRTQTGKASRFLHVAERAILSDPKEEQIAAAVVVVRRTQDGTRVAIAMSQRSDLLESLSFALGLAQNKLLASDPAGHGPITHELVMWEPEEAPPMERINAIH